MKLYEISELNEIRQVLDDAMLRADKAFTCLNDKKTRDEGFNHLAQSIKTMTNLKKRLKDLSELKVTRDKPDRGEWP